MCRHRKTANPNPIARLSTTIASAARRRAACDGAGRAGVRPQLPIGASWVDRDLRLDLDGNAEGQLGHAHRRACVLSTLRAVQLHDQVGEAIDDRGLLFETGRGIDHSEDPDPRRYPVEVAQLALEAAEDRQRGEACACLLYTSPSPRD